MLGAFTGCWSNLSTGRNIGAVGMSHEVHMDPWVSCSRQWCISLCASFTIRKRQTNVWYGVVTAMAKASAMCCNFQCRHVGEKIHNEQFAHSTLIPFIVQHKTLQQFGKAGQQCYEARKHGCWFQNRHMQVTPYTAEQPQLLQRVPS